MHKKLAFIYLNISILIIIKLTLNSVDQFLLSTFHLPLSSRPDSNRELSGSPKGELPGTCLLSACQMLESWFLPVWMNPLSLPIVIGIPQGGKALHAPPPIGEKLGLLRLSRVKSFRQCCRSFPPGGRLGKGVKAREGLYKKIRVLVIIAESHLNCKQQFIWYSRKLVFVVYSKINRILSNRQGNMAGQTAVNWVFNYRWKRSIYFSKMYSLLLCPPVISLRIPIFSISAISL